MQRIANIPIIRSQDDLGKIFREDVLEPGGTHDLSREERFMLGMLKCIGATDPESGDYVILLPTLVAKAKGAKKPELFFVVRIDPHEDLGRRSLQPPIKEVKDASAYVEIKRAGMTIFGDENDWALVPGVGITPVSPVMGVEELWALHESLEKAKPGERVREELSRIATPEFVNKVFTKEHYFGSTEPRESRGVMIRRHLFTLEISDDELLLLSHSPYVVLLPSNILGLDGWHGRAASTVGFKKYYRMNIVNGKAEVEFTDTRLAPKAKKTKENTPKGAKN